MTSKGKIREAKATYSALDRGREAFSRWELDYRKRTLKALTPQRAFKIFSGLWHLASIDPKALEAMRMKRIEYLVEVRKCLGKLEGASR